MHLLAITHRGGVRIGEVGLLLVLASGVLFAVGSATTGRRTASLVGGIALAAGAALLIVATHWGHFG